MLRALPSSDRNIRHLHRQCSEAVLSSSLIAVLRMRGLMSVGAIEVVGGRQAPARLAFVQKAVIAQVVVGVGDRM